MKEQCVVSEITVTYYLTLGQNSVISERQQAFGEGVRGYKQRDLQTILGIHINSSCRQSCTQMTEDN